MTATSSPPVRVGVDLGGTGTRAVAVVDGTVTASSDSLTARMLRAVLGAGPADPQLLNDARRRAATEPAVRDVFAAYGRAVGRGLAALHSLHQPAVTVLGGSAATCLPLFADGVREALHRSPDFDVRVEIRATSLGDNAGAVGAAVGLPSRARVS